MNIKETLGSEYDITSNMILTRKSNDTIKLYPIIIINGIGYYNESAPMKSTKSIDDISVSFPNSNEQLYSMSEDEVLATIVYGETDIFYAVDNKLIVSGYDELVKNGFKEIGPA